MPVIEASHIEEHIHVICKQLVYRPRQVGTDVGPALTAAKCMCRAGSANRRELASASVWTQALPVLLFAPP